MDPKIELSLVGLSHRTAPVAVRERYIVGPADLQACLASLQQQPGVCESFVISTCNRTEVLVIGARGLDLAPQVRSQVFRNAEDGHLYVYRDVEAVIHLFRVASGLDSVVVGESEILGQIKRNFDVALAVRSVGPTLKPLVQQALQVGKRVRTETEVGRGTLSVARVGVDVAARVFGRFDSARALIVGAGETGVLVARHLAGLGIRELVFANRTRERAENVAAEFGARSHGLDELRGSIAASDLVVACVDGASARIDEELFERRELKKRDRPMLVIDLSVPRAVAPEVAKLPNLLLYDLDDLGRVVAENKKGREGAADGSSEIVVAELHKFLALRTYAAFSPVIAEMRGRFEEAREELLDKIAGARSDPKEVQLAHELTKKLLDIAMNQLKEGARTTRSEEALVREYRRFLEKQ
jgi:glutamyl-tRNA reductase